MKRRRIFLPAAMVLATSIPLAAAQQSAPDTIAAPGETMALTVNAVGAQIDDCKGDATEKPVWQFREPVATLLVDGKTVGRHYNGPAGELADGSVITGKVTGRTPGTTASDIPWLRLEVAARRGSGQLTAVTTIQRINTAGGVAAGPCDKAGVFLSMPYTSDYVFLKKGS